MLESALTVVVDDRIWALERPVWFSGARPRARTTVVRLDDGSLLLHTPAPPSDAFAEQLRALGLYHRPTQTLLGADIVCSAGAQDHWTWRCGARLTGCYGRVRVPPDARKKIPDKAAAARSLHAMLERPAQRLIIGHGDVIEAGCRDQLARAWRLEGVEV